MIKLKFNRVQKNIPDGYYSHQFPEVVKEELVLQFTLHRGQIVRVVDGSYNFDASTGIARHGIDPLFKNQRATIIRMDCEKYISTNCTYLIVQTDLLLLFEDGTEVYCASNCVQSI